MGMGFTFIVSPDKLEEPPESARTCVETSMVPESESDSSTMSFAQDVFKFSVATVLAMVLSGISLNILN